MNEGLYFMASRLYTSSLSYLSRSAWDTHKKKVALYLVQRKWCRSAIKADLAKYYSGIISLASEIDRSEYSVRIIIEPKDAESADIVLVSLMSIEDCFVFLRYAHLLPSGPKFIIGGQGLINPYLFTSFADGLFFGRGEGIVNDILAFISHQSFWIKRDDPNFDGTYSWSQPSRLLYGESSVGCLKKCLFCQYSWLHRRLACDGGSYYTASGIGEHCFEDIDFTARKSYICAIDGLSQGTRTRNRKNLTESQIESQIGSLLANNPNKAISIKMTSIVAMPWEKIDYQIFSEFLSLISRFDCDSNKTVRITLNLCHFIPMAFTPLFNLGVQLVSLRDVFHGRLKIYTGETFVVNINPKLSSFTLPILKCAAQRAMPSEVPLINHVAQQRFYNKTSSDKWKFIRSNFPKYLYSEIPIDTDLPQSKIIAPYNYRGAAHVLSQGQR
jgi:hypothetical protein